MAVPAIWSQKVSPNLKNIVFHNKFKRKFETTKVDTLLILYPFSFFVCAKKVHNYMVYMDSASIVNTFVRCHHAFELISLMTLVELEATYGM